MTKDPTENKRSRGLRWRLRAWGIWFRRLVLRPLHAAEAKEVRASVEAEGRLSERFILMAGLSAGIATLGLLQSSTAVVIGAMLVSPLMSPIAALGFAFASFDAKRAEKAAWGLGFGALVGIAIGASLTALSPIRDPTPEILARTTPTLLDLAVATLSGIAGGYATVHRKGETAIGVAIATALMPPLATVGYSLAVGRLDFAGGAMLLFLTNLAAITFSFALVGYIRGVARPASKIEITPIHTAAAIGAFLLLATPLALTLQRVSREAVASNAARQEISAAMRGASPQIAQLTVHWNNLGDPEIAATVIANSFTPNAQAELTQRLSRRLSANVSLRIQQIVAADQDSQASALAEAAMARLPASLRSRGADATAPIAAVVSASRTPIVTAWPEPERRVIHLLAAPNDAFDLAAFRAEEARLANLGLGWGIELIPPYLDRITVHFADGATTLDANAEELEIARWALVRWASRRVTVEGLSGSASASGARAMASLRAQALAAALTPIGVTSSIQDVPIADMRRLAAQGGADRVRAVDILPFANN